MERKIADEVTAKKVNFCAPIEFGPVSGISIKLLNYIAIQKIVKTLWVFRIYFQAVSDLLGLEVFDAPFCELTAIIARNSRKWQSFTVADQQR